MKMLSKAIFTVLFHYCLVLYIQHSKISNFKGHGYEADFLGFLQKLVPHRSLTLLFELFRFWLRILGDIRNQKRLLDSATLRLGDSGSRFSITNISENLKSKSERLELWCKGLCRIGLCKNLRNPPHCHVPLIWRPIAPSYKSPNARGRGGVAGYQPMSTAVHEAQRNFGDLTLLYTVKRPKFGNGP